MQYSLYYGPLPWCTTIAPPTRGWSTCRLITLGYHWLHPYFHPFWWNYTISCILWDALEHTRTLSCGVVIPVHLYTCVTVIRMYTFYMYTICPPYIQLQSMKEWNRGTPTLPRQAATQLQGGDFIVSPTYFERITPLLTLRAGWGCPPYYSPPSAIIKTARRTTTVSWVSLRLAPPEDNAHKH